MRAMDVMTSEVITVDENASVTAVAKLLAERGISAVPVVDQDNRVIGMVSEGDLLHRAETGTERRRSWWLEMMASTNQLAGDYVKSHGRTVKDVMTRDVISVTVETPLADVALLLETNGIKRVPVTRDVQRCDTVADSTERIVGYDVRYEYNGREFRARMPFDPGNQIAVNVEVRPPAANQPVYGPRTPSYRGTY